MKLRELAAGLPFPYEITGDENTEISDVCTDTRRLTKGSLFVCVKGLKTDSHLLAPQAEQAGAAALVTERKLDTALPQMEKIAVISSMPRPTATFASTKRMKCRRANSGLCSSRKDAAEEKIPIAKNRTSRP